MTYRIGFDIGSTTIKAVVMDDNGTILYKSYERHMAQIREMALKKIEELTKFEFFPTLPAEVKTQKDAASWGL